MASEVSGKDLPKLRVVRLDRLNDRVGPNNPAGRELPVDNQKITEQAVSVTFSANAASKASLQKVAQLAAGNIQKEVSVAMEQAARNKKEDVETLAKRVAEDVRDDPDSALNAIGLTGESAEVLKSTPRP